METDDQPVDTELSRALDALGAMQFMERTHLGLSFSSACSSWVPSLAPSGVNARLRERVVKMHQAIYSNQAKWPSAVALVVHIEALAREMEGE